MDHSVNHAPKKQFGQNFLHNEGLIYRWLDHLKLDSSQDHLIEIGPGRGALSRHLISKCSQYDLLEIDRDLIVSLEELLEPYSHCRLHCVDAASVNPHDYVVPGLRTRIVGNLPYNVGTVLLFHWLNQPTSNIYDLAFMLQKEVVERIIAKPGSSDFGRLSVMVQACCKSVQAGPIARSKDFWPAPKVDSQFVRLVPDWARVEECIDHWAEFGALVTHVFTMKRKMLRRSLKGFIDEAGFDELGLSSSYRPEALSVNDFISLSNYLVKKGTSFR